MKKTLKIFITIFLIFSGFIIFSVISTLIILAIVAIASPNYVNGYYAEAKINYGVLLSKPSKFDEIYSYEFGEGEDFYIFNYDKSVDIKKIIKENKFQKITENNLEEITKVLNIYRNDLCENELNIFDKTTTIEELAKIGNYYLYPTDMNMEDDNHYSIQIIFPEKKKVYYFAINH